MRSDRRGRGPGPAPAGAGRAGAGAAPPPPHRMTGADDRPRVPSTAELRSAGLGAGLDVVEVASAEPFVEVRQHAGAPQGAGAARGHGLHLPAAGALHRPRAPRCASARALVVGARSYLVDRPDGAAAGPVGQIARYAWDDHYAHLKTGLKAVAAVAEGPRLARPGARGRQRDGRPRRRPPRRHRLVGQERQPAAPRARAAGTSSAPSSPTRRWRRRASRSRTAAGAAPAAWTAAPRGPSRRRAWSTPVAACRGSCRPRGRSRPSSGSRSVIGSTAATTARRCARRTGAHQLAPPPGPRSRTRAPARPARPG